MPEDKKQYSTPEDVKTKTRQKEEMVQANQVGLWKTYKWQVLAIAVGSFGAGYGTAYYIHAPAQAVAESV